MNMYSTKKHLYSICVVGVLFILLVACNSPAAAPPNIPGATDGTPGAYHKIPSDANIDRSGMTLYWQHRDLRLQDESALLSLYVAADRMSDGQIGFDDGQDWLLVLETAYGDFPLFQRSHVQIGKVSCIVFYDEDLLNFIVTVEQTAGLSIYNCIFDEDKKEVIVNPLYFAGGINMIGHSYEMPEENLTERLTR